MKQVAPLSIHIYDKKLSSDSRTTLKRIPDDGSLEKVEMDVLWVHSNVQLRNLPCDDLIPSTSEQCFVF